MANSFHRLLAFYANRSPHPNKQTVRLTDSIRGNLALGLDFPVALAVALTRHLFLRNSGLVSFTICIPKVTIEKTPLEGVPINKHHKYSRSEIVSLAKKKNGWVSSMDTLGVWSLAADVRTGLISGEDLKAFQEGTLLEIVETRRKDRKQVLPFWRGGPINAAGHSWAVRTVFGVDVYRESN